MWSRLVRFVLHPPIQHQRIASASVAVLLLRLVEGAACWAIVSVVFGGVTVRAWAVHLDFTAYTLVNLALFFVHRREGLTPGLVWLDIAANLLPMGVAAHWTGGIYSPLLPIFALKIGSYGLIYGADIGVQSLVVSVIMAAAIAALEHLGLGPTEALAQVPLLARQRLALAFEALILGIAVGGGLRFFRILQERESRLGTVVLEKQALYEESLRHQSELRRLSQKMLQVSEATMRRLARELHDDLGQALTAVRIDLGLIDRELAAESALHDRVREAREQIGAILRVVRDLSQLLRPAVLDDLGLIPAMQSYLSGFSERTDVLVTLNVPKLEKRLPAPVEVTLYRALQEALTNVARHSGAHNVHVSLQTWPDTVTLQIGDDGRGFDAAAFLRAPPPQHGMGLIGMRERAATYGGRFDIASRPGAGTRVELTLPLGAAREGMEEGYGDDSRLVG
jgi:signal transduction histidine kinase